MGDWIDDLKEADKEEAKKLHEIRRQKNRENELLDVKGPEFWREVLDCIEKDIEKLAREFPGRAKYALTLRKPGDQVHIEGGEYPQVTAVLPLQPVGSSVPMLLSEKPDRHTRPIEKREEAKLSLDSDENVIIRFQTTSSRDPRKIAESILKIVIGGSVK